MGSVVPTARGTVVAGLLCLTSCQDPADGTQRTAGSDGAGAEATTAATGGEPAFDPPPYLLYFSGFEAGRSVVGVQVDDRDVYWNLNGGRIMRAPKEGGGEPELFLQCASCEPYSFATDEGFVYFLNGSQVLRVDRETRQELEIPLDLDHLRAGALIIDENYVFIAMPGCAVITRIHKQTLAKEVMQIEGIAFPGAGVTTLDKAGDTIVCGSPTDLFLVSEWGQAQHAYGGIDALWAFAVAGEVGFWLEQPSANPPPVKIGRLAIFGGESAVVVEETQAGKTNRMVFASAIDKLLYGTASAIRAFDPGTESLGALVELSGDAPAQLAGRANDVAVDDVAVYATVGGRVRQVANGEETFPQGNWIAKVPLELLQ